MAVEIDNAQLKALMRLKPTIEDTAAMFECSSRTIDRYIRENFDCNFKEFRQRYMASSRHDLVRKALEMALSGNVPLLIFTLKNMCGWKDRPDIIDLDESESKQPVILSDAQLRELVGAARGLKAVK